MRFGVASDLLTEHGRSIRREGWNGKGMSLHRTDCDSSHGPYVTIKAVDGKLYPWNPSQQDLFASDWYVQSEDGDGWYSEP